MKKILEQRKNVDSSIRTRPGYGYRVLQALVLVGVIMAMNQAYAASGELLFSGSKSGKHTFGSADCGSWGGTLVVFNSPSAGEPSKTKFSLGFRSMDYKLSLTSEKLGFCRRENSSQGIFWRHVDNNWTLVLKGVHVSCISFENGGDSLPANIEVNLTGTLACTHNVTQIGYE